MNRERILQDIKKNLQEQGLERITEKLSAKFFNMEYVIKALYVALTTGKNILLYGKGGYGKSQIVKEFLKLANIQSSTIVAYEDMEVEALLGLPDIKKLTEESKYEIAFENSVFTNPGVLVLEEFLDARPATAAALKDILSEKGYRRGDEFIESAISSVIICTNKSPEDVSNNESTKALYKERFPIAVEVKWDKHDYDNYMRFIQVVRPKHENENYSVLAELCARTSASEQLISPRVVLDALDILDEHGDIKDLQLLPAIDTSIIDDVMRTQHLRREKYRTETICYNVETYIKTLRAREETTVSFIINAIAEAAYLTSKLTELSVDHPENAAMILKAMEACKNLKEAMSSKIDTNLHKISKSTLDRLFTV